MKQVTIAVVVSMMMVLAAGLGVYSYGQDGSSLSGKVIETMDSGGYTYALIEKSGEKTWVAMPQTKIKKGQTLAFQPGMGMANFKSKSLNRTFDMIYFSGGVLP